MPVVPPAPATFSTTNCCPSARESCSATMRPVMSAGPPAANGTMTVTARAGQLCADAGVAPASATSAITAASLVIEVSSPRRRARSAGFYRSLGSRPRFTSFPAELALGGGGPDLGLGLALGLDLARGHGPALPIDVEDDAVGVLELALEIVVVGIAQIEEELAPGLLDPLLLLREVVALEAEVMDADELARILQPGPDLALVLQQREIDLAVAHVDAPGGRPFRF